MLHETARHAIHSFETLKVTVQTLEALQQQVKNVSSNRQDNEKQANAPHQIWTQVDFQVRMLRNLLHRSQSNKERLQNEISLVGANALVRVHRLTNAGIQHDCSARQPGDDRIRGGIKA
ncbi:hypothetical protein BS50DRAFT_580197 [Corynespora cassiicola Philippines]|uniref:Fungal N-terminal domain-containing protein n=1 Tax=Corynespora cassiicola Philippines TaxID=1448308 RepID=A0A2T2N259_CORCC|nr:hypothetical protein BS50DRAFT_580197 [Corynespora cassiicola Philippines]